LSVEGLTYEIHFFFFVAESVATRKERVGAALGETRQCTEVHAQTDLWVNSLRHVDIFSFNAQK